jgi:hypothetical protein
MRCSGGRIEDAFEPGHEDLRDAHPQEGAGDGSPQQNHQGFAPDECPELPAPGPQCAQDGEVPPALVEPQGEHQARRPHQHHHGKGELQASEPVQIHGGEAGADGLLG